MRKFEPLSADIEYVLSSTAASVPRVARVTAIVAGKVQLNSEELKTLDGVMTHPHGSSPVI